MGLISIFHKKTGKKKAMAFVDYEHWYYSLQKNFGLKPDPYAWRQRLEEKYNLEEVMVFADFGHKGIAAEVPKIRTITNTIIETQQSFTHYKKDMTDFIMLDYIYQTAYTRPKIDIFILFTGDGHFQSVTKYLTQQLKKEVIVYGIQDSVSSHLQKVASKSYTLPATEDGLRPYYEMIVENMASVAEKVRIIPTFKGTVSAIVNKYQAPEQLVHAALHEMMQKGYIYQKMQRVDFNRSVKVLAADWEKLAEDGALEI